MSDLTRFRDYCREMAADATTADWQADRDLWTALADEIDRYLTDNPDDTPTPTTDPAHDVPLDLTLTEPPD